MAGTSSAAATPSAADLRRWRGNWQHERAGAEILRTMARRARSPEHAAVLTRLAERESAHAAHWAALLQSAGAPLPTPAPSLYDRLVLALAKRLRPRDVLPLVAADAVRSLRAYQLDAHAGPLVNSERVVASQVRALTFGATPAEAMEAGRGHRRSAATSGSVRAAVFGVNDGLVSNLSLVMGVAGAAPDNQWVILSGLAGLLAGAFSMGGGEFISMLSQRELAERELEVERRDLERDPEGELENLAAIYRDKGLTPEQARLVATQLMADPDVALDTIARELLGLDPDELGSPRGAAVASFLSFTVGAALPLLPFFFLPGNAAVIAAVLVGAVGLFVVGVLVSYFTARSPLVSGLRMLGIGLGAAALTYLVGRLIGVSVVG